MTSLNEIENFLNIEIGDKRIRAGKKYENKNKYYYKLRVFIFIEDRNKKLRKSISQKMIINYRIKISIKRIVIYLLYLSKAMYSI